MNTHTTLKNLQIRSSFNPIHKLKPENLSHILDSFHAGYLAPAAKLWDAIERRDDVLHGVIAKRKKSVARLRWEILTSDQSAEAMAQKEALEYFYNHLECTNATDANEQGNIGLLIKHMMDAVGKQYAIHEIIFKPQLHSSPPRITATFQFVPLWFFQKKNNELIFKHPDNQQSMPLKRGSWLVTKGEGLMESSSICYIFKQLPLKDWLIYCQRNGMPGVKGITDAQPGSQAWESAKEAVLDFGAEFHALMSRGTDIQPIDLTAKGTLPYPGLVERMDRAMIALWRGSDLNTLARADSFGASVQSNESALLEEDDALLISETLNTQVDKLVLEYLFKTKHPKAYFKLIPRDIRDKKEDLHMYQTLQTMGFHIPKNHIAERFGIPMNQETK